jgi:hypothetical protein
MSIRMRTLRRACVCVRCRLRADLCTAARLAVPAHLMRSVAGGFDNESIAISAIVATFYLWARSLRTPYAARVSPLPPHSPHPIARTQTASVHRTLQS